MEDNFTPLLRNLPRAKPPEGLYQKIEDRISEAKTVSLADWRSFAAAAVLIAAINVTALVQYTQAATNSSSDVASVESGLISDYELYY